MAEQKGRKDTAASTEGRDAPVQPIVSFENLADELDTGKQRKGINVLVKKIGETYWVHSVPVYGTNEIGYILGVKRHTISQWRYRGKMPDPSVVLSTGPVWTRDVAEAFMTRITQGKVQFVRNDELNHPSLRDEGGRGKR